MRELTVDAIIRLAYTALERTCFVDIGACDNCVELATALAHFVKIGYTGAEQGSVVLGATDGFVRHLACAIMGDHVADVYLTSIGTDALREVANVLAGSIVRELGAESNALQIGLPSECDRSALPKHDAVIAVI